ncbi:MAG: CaiB/BaiF CoA-transferase family protein [Pseudomonadota bacterium]
MSDSGALSGIKVLDLSRLLPGPYCSMILADHGAQVISIEDKRYKTAGLYVPVINRNKQHISLDLKTVEGKEIFFRLAKDTDVIIEGFRPGVVKRLGIDYEVIRQVNPKIIYCSITGYGQTGPLNDRAGHDVNYLSVSGLLDLMGEAGNPPSIPGIQFADMAGGGMNGAIGVLLALMARERTGQGQYVDISMTDGMAAFLPISLFFQQITGQYPRRADNMLSHRYAFYNTYETADGRYMSVGALEPQFWSRLCEKLNVPEFIPLQYDEKRRPEIIRTFRKIFKSRTLGQWEIELAQLDACCEPVRQVEEVMQSQLFREREMVVEISEKDGRKTRTLGVPVKLSRTPGAIRTPPVAFGENTRDVLLCLGYTEDEIAVLAEKDVI